MIFDKQLKVKIDKQKQTVSLSIKVSDSMVNVFKIGMAEFNIMIAEYQSQLVDAENAELNLDQDKTI